MAGADDIPAGLRVGLEEWAAGLAAEVVAEAERDARAEVARELRAAMRDALLARCRDALAPTPARPEPPRPEPPRPEPARPEPSREAGDGVYVFCVASEATAERAVGIAGIAAGTTVEAVRHHGLAALVAPVPLAEFGDETLKENLNDLAWLEATARGHERVLEHALRAGTLVPLRLCTLYRDEAGVRDMLGRERGALCEALAVLAGRTEWGMKVFVDRSALLDAARARCIDGPGPEPSREGEAYLARKRADRAAREESEALLEGCVRELHARALECVADAVVNQVQRREATGRDEDMVFNAAYLVEDEHVERLRELAEEHAATFSGAGIQVELTGPWPPYNFVTAPLGAAP